MTANPLHSAIKNEHYTPKLLVEVARAALGGSIDLDVASDIQGNLTIQAQKFFSKEDDGYSKDWIASTVFCNPPGRIKGNRKMPGSYEWFCKMLTEYWKGNFSSGIFIGYSLELLSKALISVNDFRLPFCVPQPHSDITSGMGRICFDSWNEDTREMVSQKSPQHGNVIIFFPPVSKKQEASNEFRRLMLPIGSTVIPS